MKSEPDMSKTNEIIAEAGRLLDDAPADAATYAAVYLAFTEVLIAQTKALAAARAELGAFRAAKPSATRHERVVRHLRELCVTASSNRQFLAPDPLVRLLESATTGAYVPLSKEAAKAQSDQARNGPYQIIWPDPDITTWNK